MKAKVTVLIPSYNPGCYLVKALDSVFNQTYQNWQIILVDDASTDDSLSLAKEYLTDPRVKVIKNSQNLGQSKSLNIGLAMVSTPYLIQLDSDDWFCSDTLETMMNEVKNLPNDVAVLFGNWKTIYEDSKGNKVKTKINKGRIYKDRYDFLLANRTVRPRFYRTSCLKKIGGWAISGPYEGRYTEDKRILLRLIKDYRFHWIDKLLYNYRKHTQTLSKQSGKSIKTLKWITRDALKRWGDKYKPVFKTNQYAIKKIKLVPKHSKNSSGL